jgi:hypothetical protein
MKTSVHPLVLASLLLSACTTLHTPNRTMFQIGLMGDMPYTTEEEKKMPALMEDMNRHDLAFVVQNGDFQADPRGYRDGMVPCTDATLLARVEMFQSSKHPLVVTPGDNDWTDCAHAKPPIDPMPRLAKLREVLYRDNLSLGQRKMAVMQQSDDPNYAIFRENVRWNVGEVAFATIHIVGSNNNLGRTPEMDGEYRERNAASLAWLRLVFHHAKLESRKGLMIVIQANPRFEDKWPRGYFGRLRTTPPGKEASGFSDFLAALEEETLAYGKPVVLVHGDTHYFRIDKPLIGTKSGRAIENFTRVENFSTPDVHWLRVTVDPSDPQVFTFRQEIVAKNLSNHGGL